MNQTNQVFIVTFAIIAIGYLLKRFDFITEKDGKVISKFVMHSTFPALMILSMSRAKLESSQAIVPILAIVAGLVMIALAWYMVSGYQNAQRGVLMMGVGGFNTGLFGFPIINDLFGKEGLSYAIGFDIGVTFMVFAVLYPLAASFSEQHKNGLEAKHVFRKVVTSPPVTAAFIGLIINVLAIQIPTLCVDILETIAKGNKPIVLLLMGIYLSFDLDKKQRISIYKLLGIRYLVGIVAVVGIYYFFAQNNLVMRNVLMLCMILPIGMTILPFSDEMGLDSRLAGTLLNLSLVISFVFLWGLMLLIR